MYQNQPPSQSSRGLAIFRLLGVALFVVVFGLVGVYLFWGDRGESVQSHIQSIETLPIYATPRQSSEKRELVINKAQSSTISNENSLTTNQPPSPEAYANLPKTTNLDIPFFSQAPDGDRSLPWQDACEEASITLATYFIQGIRPDLPTYKSDILGLVELQKDMFGSYIDTTLAQTAQLLKAYYGIGNAFIIDDPTTEEIKYWLAQGHPIIAPLAGRQLGNPHFTDRGPRYHMLVIRGYDDTYFYTNDVGTRHGENFPYTHEILMNAIHDLTSGDITQGEKRVLVILKDG